MLPRLFELDPRTQGPVLPKLVRGGRKLPRRPWRAPLGTWDRRPFVGPISRIIASVAFQRERRRATLVVQVRPKAKCGTPSVDGGPLGSSAHPTPLRPHWKTRRQGRFPELSNYHKIRAKGPVATQSPAVARKGSPGVCQSRFTCAYRRASSASRGVTIGRRLSYRKSSGDRTQLIQQEPSAGENKNKRRCCQSSDIYPGIRRAIGAHLPRRVG